MNITFFILLEKNYYKMVAITMFKDILFLSLFISVWTLPTIVRRQSDSSLCTAELKDLKKGVGVSRIVLVSRFNKYILVYLFIE